MYRDHRNRRAKRGAAQTADFGRLVVKKTRSGYGEENPEGNWNHDAG
jgi:predicted DNA-binding WGR domain protein